MIIRESPLPGLLIIEPKLFEDSRGYFFESFNRKNLMDAGVDTQFVQDNQSLSQYGVLRGLHYQLAPYAQSKLVRVLQGSVWDVAVDIRKNSPTFGQYYGIELSAENKIQLFIPQGFAHGFAVTSQTAVFFYKCDSFYNPESERGIHFNDPGLAIPWPIPESEAIISAKDKVLPLFKQATMNFVYQ
ncbi:MAG: dTDP-4-dehydrorhamnose 3,5-epimerase [Porphyromonadaceae bacterium]|nr:MAG: dTDP-4-dehydrorhamnose 3,5-epimerase [Porphyromonadaceae bacterium]